MRTGLFHIPSAELAPSTWFVLPTTTGSLGWDVLETVAIVAPSCHQAELGTLSELC